VYSFHESSYDAINEDSTVNDHGAISNENEVTCEKAASEEQTTQEYKYVIYINWDGFAYDFYEWANSPGAPGTPVLNYLASRGALLTKAYTGFPAQQCLCKQV